MVYRSALRKPWDSVARSSRLHVHVDVAHGPVGGQVEHRLAVPAQVGGGGPGGSSEKLSCTTLPSSADDDDPHRVLVEALQVLALVPSSDRSLPVRPG